MLHALKRRESLTLLAIVLVVSVLGAVALHRTVLQKSTATIGMQIFGDVQLYRRLQESLFSPTALDAFAQASGATGQDAYAVLRARFLDGGAGLLISHVYGVSQADVRELPAGSQPNLWTETAAGRGPGPNDNAVRSRLVLMVRLSDPELSERAASLGIRYVRDLATKLVVQDLVGHLRARGEVMTATHSRAVFELQEDLASLNRRLTAFEQLATPAAEPAAEGGAGTIQFQVNDGKYLSPQRQALALRGEKITKDDALAINTRELSQGMLSKDLAARMAELLTSTVTGQASLAAVLELLESVSKQPPAGYEERDVRLVLAELGEQLAILRSYLIEMPFVPPTPVVRDASPSVILMLLLAVLAAISFWLILMRVFHGLRTEEQERYQPPERSAEQPIFTRRIEPRAGT